MMLSIPLCLGQSLPPEIDLLFQLGIETRVEECNRRAENHLQFQRGLQTRNPLTPFVGTDMRGPFMSQQLRNNLLRIAHLFPMPPQPIFQRLMAFVFACPVSLLHKKSSDVSLTYCILLSLRCAGHRQSIAHAYLSFYQELRRRKRREEFPLEGNRLKCEAVSRYPRLE